VRGYLAEEGFILVDPPGLQRSPGNEAHLHAFATTAIGNDGVGHPFYLHTSPEFSMKKLLAAGEARIASLGHVWRNRERGVPGEGGSRYGRPPPTRLKPVMNNGARHDKKNM
jgi:lysyl-tRNA synthetase class 2